MKDNHFIHVIHSYNTEHLLGAKSCVRHLIAHGYISFYKIIMEVQQQRPIYYDLVTNLVKETGTKLTFTNRQCLCLFWHL